MLIRARLVTPPAEEPVTVEELRDQLRIDGSTEDALLLGKLASARRHIEDFTGLVLSPSTWEFNLDRFPPAEIEAPKKPLLSVESVAFKAPEGSPVTVAPETLTVDPGRGWIVPAADWPETMKAINAVTVRIVAGFTEVPEPLREAILQLAGWWYEQREAAVLDTSPRAIPFGVRELASEYRDWTF